MSGRVIQANFGGGSPRLSAMMAQSAAMQWPAPPPIAQSTGAVQAKPARPGAHPKAPAQPHAATASAIFAKQSAQEATKRPASMESFPIDPVQLGLARSGGKPLPSVVLAKMETAFRQDFSAVRVHEGPQAARIGALAFTIGTDIYFAPGRFQPDSAQGQQIIGHELAHVVQQRQGRVRAPATGHAVVLDPALEAEANRLGQWATMRQVACTPDNPSRPVRATMRDVSVRSSLPRPLNTAQPSPGVAQPMLKNFWNSLTGTQNTPVRTVRLPPDLVMEEIRASEEMNQRIVVAYGAMVSPQDRINVRDQIRRFLAGTLTVWRGVQQCHPAFPAAPYTHLTAKVPGSQSPPDFANNDNNWIPFYEDRASCLSVALSWSMSIIGYFNSRGGMNSLRPCALLLQKTLDPSVDRVAFGMSPEVQIWGPTAAVPTLIGIDDDWNALWPTGPHQQGDNFRAKALAAGVTILPLPIIVNRVRANSFTETSRTNNPIPRARSGSF